MNKKIEIKKLELESGKKGFQGWIKSKQVKKTIIAILIGAVAGFVYFYLTEGQEMEAVSIGDIIQNVVFGAFLGFFVTNSPCSRVNAKKTVPFAENGFHKIQININLLKDP